VSLLGGGAQVGDRALTNGTDSINYTLFQPTDGALACDPANFLTPWGTGATSLLLTVFTGYVAKEYSVCGKIAAGQTTVGAGTYTGVVTAQVDY
jgi:spore coat protein U-like protein